MTLFAASDMRLHCQGRAGKGPGEQRSCQQDQVLEFNLVLPVVPFLSHLPSFLSPILTRALPDLVHANSVLTQQLEEGDEVLARWRGLHFFSGTVLKVHTETSDGKVLLDIEYLDGEVERGVPRSAVVPELGDDAQTDEDHKEEQELCDMARRHRKAVSMCLKRFQIDKDEKIRQLAEYEREEKENLAKFSALQAQYERNSLQLKKLEEDANRKRRQLLRPPFQQAAPAKLYASVLSQNTPNASLVDDLTNVASHTRRADKTAFALTG